MNNLLTVHMIVQNEKKWVRSAILSVLPFVAEMIVYDTGSEDETVRIIRSIKSEKIIFEEKEKSDKKRMVKLRNEQIKKTKTPWFMILDGDEVYPARVIKNASQVIERNSDSLFGIYLRNYVCVGDVWHKLPERYGRYEFCGHKGHLNLRFYKMMENWKWHGEYPLEYYSDEKGNSINTMCDKLYFLDDYYWHMSFLERSSIKRKNHVKYHLGEKIKGGLPEVFEMAHVKKRSTAYAVRSLIETPIRYLKQ